MKNRLIIIAAALVAVLAMALPAGAASPAPAPRAVQCPKGKLVVNVTEKVANDLGYASYYNDPNGLTFAIQDYNRLIKAWEVGPGSYCTEVKYEGSFVTVAGASPGGTDPNIAAGITGRLKGSYVATFSLAPNPSPVWSPRGNIGSIDNACNPDTFDCPGYVNWVAVFFNGYPGDFAFQSHDFQYSTAKNGTFLQHLETFEGDITDGVGPSNKVSAAPDAGTIASLGKGDIKTRP